MPDSFNLSVSASALNTAIQQASAAAPQSTTYTKEEVDKMVKGYTTTSSDGSFSSLLHSAATYCGVDDSNVVNGFVIVTTDNDSEYLIGFFNFKYSRNVAFATISNNDITYGSQSQYGTLTFLAVAGTSYKATVTFI